MGKGDFSLQREFQTARSPKILPVSQVFSKDLSLIEPKDLVTIVTDHWSLLQR
jgi:hypothetical protein